MVWADTDDNPLAPKGATGYGVRLLLDLAMEFSGV
jgi:leucyl aminopeptidase